MDVPTQPLRLNLGCGAVKIDGFTGVDVAGQPDIVSDIRNLPLPDDSVEEAISIHVIEHIYRWEVPDMLVEWRRVLKPGAMLAIECPDFAKCCANYLKNDAPRMSVWGFYGDPTLREPLMVHRWGWTPKELTWVLREAGFREITTKPPQFHKPDRDFRVEAIK